MPRDNIAMQLQLPFGNADQTVADSSLMQFDSGVLGELAEWLAKNIGDGSLDESLFSPCPPHPGATGGSVADPSGAAANSYDGQVPPQPGQPIMAVLPVSTPYPGPYHFQLEFGKQPKETKSAAWTFSPTLNKLYAQKDAMCPVRFRVDSSMGGGLFIRALPIFLRHEYVQEIVRRCPNHVQAPENANVRHKEHFVWCEHPSAQYVSGGSSLAAAGRLSVVVPVEQAPAGTPWVTYLYSFKCLNSCVGGPNRREMTMIFTLENQAGDIFGRQSFDLRICACPGRDRKTDEGKLETPPVATAAVASAAAAAGGAAVAVSLPSPQSPGGSPASAVAVAERSLPSQPTVVSLQQPGPSSVGPSAGAAAMLARRGRLTETTSEATTAKRSRIADVEEEEDDDDNEEGEVFNIYVRGRENFEMLCQIRDSLELADIVRPADKDRYMQRRHYSDGPVTIADSSGGMAVAERGRTAFTFSCDRDAIKTEVVDSTQPGSSGSAGGAGIGHDMTDSAAVSSTCNDEPTSVRVDTWVSAVGFSKYRENFRRLGFETMGQLMEHLPTVDLGSVGIPNEDRGTLWRHLLLYKLRISKRRVIVVHAGPGNEPAVSLSNASRSLGSAASRRPVVLTLSDLPPPSEGSSPPAAEVDSHPDDE